MKTEKMIDLFGDEIIVKVSESKRKPTVKKGYAAIPGTGPEGETCKTCCFAIRCGSFGGKNYSKCGKFRHHWTAGEGTDILLKSPACRHWEPSGKRGR